MFDSTLNPLWQRYILAVQEEVKPALGCTEPISLALAAAVAAAELEGPVERVEAWVSPNLMKNGLGVTVPGTGMVGLPIAAALGALGGNANAGLEVLKDATAQAISDAKALLAAGKVSVKIQEPCDEILFSRAKVWNGEKWACVTIVGGHTNIVHIETHNGVVFTQQACVTEGEQESPLTVLSRTTLAEILKFVNEVPFAAIRFILDSAKLNCALSQEGLSGNWGLHIGATLEKQCARGLLAKDLSSSIVIRTSAASDARMGGATLPAMSNSGSGNQGITATMPVVVVAEHFGADDERLARALMLSHLSAIYIHNQLPRLSALCAATTAAMGAAAGMAWLVDGRYETISMAISSMIGDVSGMICDGASNSCAMKVSTSASAAWKAVLMALDDTAVTGNEGIVAHDVEQSIANLCALASHSMQQTDRQIIEIMASKARQTPGFGYCAGCDAGASYLAYELHNLLMLLGFVGRIRRLRRIRQPVFTRWLHPRLNAFQHPRRWLPVRSTSLHSQNFWRYEQVLSPPRASLAGAFWPIFYSSSSPCKNN